MERLAIQISIDIFSGRINSHFILTDEVAHRWLLKIRDARQSISSSRGFNHLGFRGIFVRTLDGDITSYSLPSQFWLATGTSVAESDGIALAREVIKYAPIEYLPEHMQNEMLAQMESFEKNLENFLKLPNNTISEVTGPGPSDVKGYPCSFEFPLYDPNFWNYDPVRLCRNNCYAYACNMPLNTFPQPGVAHGHSTTYLGCQDLIIASTLDGLEQICAPDSQSPRWYVALVSAPSMTSKEILDYHWYRQAAEGFWGHKPGSTEVRNYDDSGVLIWNPATANRGIYSNFCTYMTVRYPIVQIAGSALPPWC